MLEPEDHLETAEKIRTGEYYREARQAYDLAVHDTMSERYFFILIMILSAMILVTAIAGMQGLYPLNTSVPFIVSTQNIVDDLPRIHALITYPGEEPGTALLNYLVRDYVAFREEYDVNTFDRNISGVQSQSSSEVFDEFERFVDPHNTESPTALYERHSKRNITIVSTRMIGNSRNEMEVIYDAVVVSKTDVKKSRWEANITFNYSGIALDQNTGKVKPLGFLVTGYHTKRLQDLK